MSYLTDSEHFPFSHENVDGDIVITTTEDCIAIRYATIQLEKIFKDSNKAIK